MSLKAALMPAIHEAHRRTKAHDPKRIAIVHHSHSLSYVA
jgi:hypothetical protein